LTLEEACKLLEAGSQYICDYKKDKIFQKAQITIAGGFVQKYVDGAGEGIRTPASTKPTSCLAFRLSPLLFDLEAGAITTPPPRLQLKHLQLWLKEFSLETDYLFQRSVFLAAFRKTTYLQDFSFM
jgi:hypothetical protein